MAIYRGQGGAQSATDAISLNKIIELEANAEASASSADASALAAQASATSASASEAGVSADAATAAQAAIDTAADVLTTNADALTTAADVLSTAADVLTTNTNAVITNNNALSTTADAAATAADRVQTGLDATATAADRAQTGLDASTATTQAGLASTSASDALTSASNAAQAAIDTAADVVTTNADALTTTANAIATNADANTTTADAIATAADRVQTGLDATATAADAIQTSADVVTTNNNVTTTNNNVTTTNNNVIAAGNAQTAAEAAQTAAESVLDTFDDRFLGTKTVDPTLDNDGNTLLDGALYFNTSSNTMKVYNIDTITWYSLPQMYLSALLDVNLTSITSGNVLRWNGTKWINYALSKSDVGLNLVDNTSDSAKTVLSATRLETERTINGVPFNGTANITIADGTKLPLTGGTLTGSLGIATGDPTSLDITDGSGSRTLFRDGRIDAVNSANSAWRSAYLRGNESYLVHSNGSNLIGINSAGRAIANNSGSRGATGYVLTTPNDSVANLIRANGYIELQSNVGAIGVNYFVSDKKFKTNIKDYEGEDIGYKFKDIMYKSFDWNELSGRLGESEKIGFIAQEVKEIVPEFITEYSDGTLGVNTTVIVTNLMKAVKELLDYNDKLTARIEKLELMQEV